MLPSALDDPANRRKCNEVQAVPPKSPVCKIQTMPVIAEWPCNPPKKQTLFTNRSKYDGKLYDVLIDMSYDRFVNAYGAWCRGDHIQKAFPKLEPEIREFIQTGITPTQRDEMFKDEE